jgi:alkylhydroperoxidase family enzyme
MFPGAPAADRQLRLGEAVRRLVGAVLDGECSTAVDDRHAAFAGRADNAAVRRYVELVQRHAHRVTDADIEGLRSAGLGDDAIFELTVAAALGAGMERLRAGLSLLGREP